MSFYFTEDIAGPFDAAIDRVRAALERQGFGIVSDIDFQATLKARLGQDFRPYRVLGACNPTLALEALQIDDKVGLLLPCNVIVQATETDRVSVAAINPLAAMLSLHNAALHEVAASAAEKLRDAVHSLRD